MNVPMAKNPTMNRWQAPMSSLIIHHHHETPNVTSNTTEPVHQRRFSIATKLLQMKEMYKSEMYTPFSMFAGAIVDEETGKAMEYRDLINSDKYCDMWSKAM
eukprot:7853474-Ditylum_brightwellii.AAC.1